MYITDSQVHLYLPNTPERPWIQPMDSQVAEFLPETLIRLMEDAGVQRAAIVPPIWAGLDNVQCLKWSQEFPGRFGIMGRFDFANPDRSRLETWLDEPGMIGIRLSGQLNTGEWLDLDQFDWFWSAVERFGIPVMILVGRDRIKLVNSVAERHPEATILIDHFAVTIGDLSENDPWQYIDDVLALAQYPRVFGKLSALPLNTMEEYPYPSQTPYIKRAYDTFGPQRLAWGSDGSRFRRSTYKECVDHLLDTIDFLSEEDKEWIMGKTLASALNWPETDLA
jgi:L-fuconolactonase